MPEAPLVLMLNRRPEETGAYEHQLVTEKFGDGQGRMGLLRIEPQTPIDHMHYCEKLRPVAVLLREKNDWGGVYDTARQLGIPHVLYVPDDDEGQGSLQLLMIEERNGTFIPF